ncbi:MAG: ABC transporter ATP-binding protein [Deltaproteobacteria bacterium]|nr:ABC transporter ATP-binding protein [Deltaproteobacteria bacterium]
MPKIELKGVSKKFEIKKTKTEFFLHPFKKSYKNVLDDINICIEKPGIYSLIGPNGSGKTTLLRIISGILYPDVGEVLINNSRFNLNPSKVFLISESERGFFPRLSLINNLKFFASLIYSNMREINKIITDILHEFDLEKEKNTRFQELSTGTKQRLAIGRAMLFNPEILLFDEITKGVDIKQQQIIYSLIKRFKDEGKTIIFATHLIKEVEELSDKVILLNQGKIFGFGNISEVTKDINRVFEIQ